MKLTYQELSNNPGSFLGKAANAAKGAVCDAYHDYKDFYYSNINLAAPAGLLITQMWDNICPMEPPYQAPPPPTPTFKGGQCTGAGYLVDYAGTDERGVAFSSQLGVRYGKIYSRKIYSENASGTSTLFTLVIYSETPQGGGVGEVAVSLYYQPGVDSKPTADITKVERIDGGLDDCGDRPAPTPPPPLAPPDRINRDITIDNDGVPTKLPFSFSPKFSFPGLSINGGIAIFKPDFNFNLAPQFNIAPSAKLDFKPDLNLQFDLDGVNLNFGGSQDNDTVNNTNNNNNINNINNNTSNTNNNVNNINNTVNNIDNNTEKTNDDVTIIKDKLACNPCDLLKEIKEKLFKVPTYRAFPVPEFQSIKRDNLADLGFIEIDLTVLPNKTKTIFGGLNDNVHFGGWIVWRKNGYNFAREQVTAAKSIYLAPKGANGFGITCTHSARANCIYYIEIKE